MSSSKFGVSLVFVLAASLSGGIARADTVSGSGGSFQSFNQNQLFNSVSTATYQSYYWNNYSPDGLANSEQSGKHRMVCDGRGPM